MQERRGIREGEGSAREEQEEEEKCNQWHLAGHRNHIPDHHSRLHEQQDVRHEAFHAMCYMPHINCHNFIVSHEMFRAMPYLQNVQEGAGGFGAGKKEEDGETVGGRKQERGSMTS